jgi:hypothetical protein
VNYSQQPDGAVQLNIKQTQSHPSVDFFEMPVPLKFFGGGKDTTLVFNNTFSDQTFSANPGFAVDSIQLDPNRWLISANNSVVMGIAPAPEIRPVTIFPNPAHDYLVVRHSWELSKVEAISPDGRIIALNQLARTANGTTFDISNLNTGMCILRLQVGKSVLNMKLMVY